MNHPLRLRLRSIPWKRFMEMYAAAAEVLEAIAAKE